jgi:hypothetical protein
MPDVNLAAIENIDLADDTITLPVRTLFQVALTLMSSKSHYETSCVSSVVCFLKCSSHKIS